MTLPSEWDSWALVGSGSLSSGPELEFTPAADSYRLQLAAVRWGLGRYGTNMARDCATDTIADTAFAFDMETGGKT